MKPTLFNCITCKVTDLKLKKANAHLALEHVVVRSNLGARTFPVYKGGRKIQTVTI